MGNCLKSSKPSKQPAAPAPETEARRRRRWENKGKKVSFNARVEVFGGECDEEELKVVKEEEKNESKSGMKERVRIRISKKQLEELLGKAEMENLSVHEMMSCLVKEHQEQEDDYQKPWMQIVDAAIPEPRIVNMIYA
ncbi:hypothetical protein QQ045_011889 [Rhodiola kirilowii]